MDSALHFKKLRSLTKKKLQTEHHLSNLKKYIPSRTVPKGLNIKVSPQAPGHKSKRFMSRWNEILFNCSIQLLQLLLSFTTTNYKQIVNEISDIINDSNISRDDLPIIKRRLADIEKIELSKHKEKQRNKFQRDKIHTVYLNQDMNDINTTNHKVPRKRKFKRRKQKTESIVSSPQPAARKIVIMPITILCGLFTGEDEIHRSVIEHVITICDRLADMSGVVKENLSHRKEKTKAWYYNRARFREFEPGDEVLLLLPSEASKNNTDALSRI
ncbi:unnamed protein product [Mytilus coruscus]|uniref:Uncharacterized protein n=1 Tax=Mytilus coruscus TaxID=42192 RepID=A0A6J7ZWU5_MYTCO|nr:unnamed protein product [Mytilus coruscus]